MGYIFLAIASTRFKYTEKIISEIFCYRFFYSLPFYILIYRDYNKISKKLHKVTQGFKNFDWILNFLAGPIRGKSRFFFRHSNLETLKDRLTQPTGHPKISACDLANCLDAFFWSPEEFSWLSSANKRSKKIV